MALSRRKKWAFGIVVMLLVLYLLVFLRGRGYFSEHYSSSGDHYIFPDTNGTPVLPHPDFSTQELPTESYNAMTMSVPMMIRGWTANITDHFTMVPNVTRLVVNITGTGAGWNMSYEVGAGEGPDNGTTKVMNPSSSGLGCVLDYSPAQGTCEQGRWFIFMQMNNPDKHRGEDCTFRLNVTVYLPWVK